MNNSELTIVFFCPNLLRDNHRYIYQLDKLVGDGYNIIMLDATQYYGHTSSATEQIILDNKVECAKKEDFVAFRESLPKKPVLYVSYDNYMKFAAPVFDIIIRKQDILLSYHTKRFASVLQPSGKLRTGFDKIVIGLDKILPLYFLKSYYKKRLKFYIPDYFLCSTEFLIPTKVYFSVPRSKRIIVHADDINHVMQDNKSIIDPTKKIGVFLDQGIPFLNRTHPKIFTEPPPEGYLNNYYKFLEKSLSELKVKLNLDEVVIALHPDAAMFSEELTDKFHDFRTFTGSTRDLIRDSRVVFGHYSAAINFAIYYKKPVIIFKDEFFMHNPMLRKFIQFFEKELDLKSIDMDKELKENLSLKDINVNEKKYMDFTRKYLKENEIQENSYYYAIKFIENDLKEQEELQKGI